MCVLEYGLYMLAFGQHPKSGDGEDYHLLLVIIFTVHTITPSYTI